MRKRVDDRDAESQSRRRLLCGKVTRHAADSDNLPPVPRSV